MVDTVTFHLGPDCEIVATLPDPLLSDRQAAEIIARGLMEDTHVVMGRVPDGAYVYTFTPEESAPS